MRYQPSFSHANPAIGFSEIRWGQDSGTRGAFKSMMQKGHVPHCVSYAWHARDNTNQLAENSISIAFFEIRRHVDAELSLCRRAACAERQSTFALCESWSLNVKRSGASSAAGDYFDVRFRLSKHDAIAQNGASCLSIWLLGTIEIELG